MKMRGAASSPSALCWRISSARLVSLPTSRMVVMPQASQMFSSYSSGCGLPPRAPLRWAGALISPGRTYLPVASITASAGVAARDPRAAATGSSGMTSAIVLFSMTMSLGPLAGVPLPSIMMALWISRRRNRLPISGGGDGVQRDDVGDRVVLDDNVLGAAGGRPVAIDHDGIVDQQAAYAFAAGRRLRRGLGGGGTSERESGERDEQGSGHRNDCGMLWGG